MNSPLNPLIKKWDLLPDKSSEIRKCCTMDKLIFGGKFSDVYKWEGVKRTEPDWTNFNKIVPLTAAERQIIDNLLN